MILFLYMLGRAYLACCACWTTPSFLKMLAGACWAYFGLDGHSDQSDFSFLRASGLQRLFLIDGNLCTCKLFAFELWYI